MAVFTPRALQIPNMRTDYSAENSAFSNLGQTLGNMPSEFRKEQLNAQKQQILGQIGTGNLDYEKAGRSLIALGDTQAGATLLTLGQKQQQLGAQKGIADIFSGGEAKAQPAPVLGAVTSSAPVASPGDPSLPAGMRNNNPGNIKFVGQSVPGIVGPSKNTDQGDPQAVFDTPESGMAAAYGLAMRKYSGGKRTANDLIAGNMGWTPGNMQAAANIARTMGIRPDEDLRLDDPSRAQAFMRALLLQEHGKASLAYSDDMIASAVSGARGQPRVAQRSAPLQGVEGDDPAKLRADAEYYARSNPAASQQFLVRAQAAEGQQPVQFAETEADVQRLEQAQAARSAQPVQVAQAPAQVGAPVADAPAPGAAAAQFAVPGSMLPPNDPYPRVTTQQLYGVLQNPMASDGQRAMAKSIIDNRMKYSDENAPDKREMTRLQTEKLRREVEGEGGRPMTPEERKAYNVPEGQPAYMKRNGDPGFGPAGTRIDLNKGENKFEEEMGKGQAKRFNDLISEGDVAQGRLADIQTLRETSRRLGSQGYSANLKSTIGPYAESLGIKVDGLSDIQLYESITNRLAPTLRAPGSGSTSDIEFKGFMRAIGPLSNAPAAREMILDTFEAASRNDIARADIASRLAQKEITRGQAEKEIRALPNPLEAFREFRKQNPDLVGQAIKESAETDRVQRAAPPVTTAEGYNALKPGDKYTDPQGNIRTKR